MRATTARDDERALCNLDGARHRQQIGTTKDSTHAGRMQNTLSSWCQQHAELSNQLGATDDKQRAKTHVRSEAVLLLSAT